MIFVVTDESEQRASFDHLSDGYCCISAGSHVGRRWYMEHGFGKLDGPLTPSSRTWTKRSVVRCFD